MHDDDDDDVAKNEIGNSVVGRVLDYVKRERRLARQFIDIYPSQFQRRLNNDFQSGAREDGLKRAMQNARRSGLGFIDIYPSQFHRGLNNDVQSRAREDRLKRAMQNARRSGLGSATADRSRQFAGCFEIWVVGTGAASPRAARITIFTHVFFGTVRYRNGVV
jgi:hypothetical protein